MDNPLWCQLCDADEEATCADWCPRRSTSEHYADLPDVEPFDPSEWLP